MRWVRTETFKIRGYEIGPDHRVPIQNLCGYMEEAAALHAAELEVSVEELARRGLAWALARTWIGFDQMPFLGGNLLNDEDSSLITVRTWPVAVERLLFRRDFLISWREKTVARAVTDWVVIDLKSRRAVRIPEFISSLNPPEPNPVMEVQRLRLPEQDHAPQLASFPVRRADIDRNNHVNNARFTEWLIESVPEDISAAKRLQALKIMYLAEGRYGDVVVARGGPEADGGFCHGLFRLADGRELVRAHSVWV